MSTENYHSNNEDDFIDRQSSVLSDVTHENGSDSSASPSQPQKKKVKVEESSPPVPSYGAFTGIAGDPNMLALGSMGMRHPAPAFNPNFSLAFGNGLPMASSFNGPQPTLQTSFPGTSPGFHSMAMPSGHPFFGFGPGYAAMANQHWSVTASTTARGNDSETPDAHSNDNDDDEQGNEGRDDAESGEGNGKPKRLSGMTPLAFAPLASNHPMMARAAVNGSFHPGLMQVVSTDSQTDSNRGGVPAMMVAPAPQLAMMHPFGNHAIPLQKPKKWVRWSDQEDLTLRRAVEQLGDNSFLHISEQIFRGTRTEAQCKSRWKKALQPGLVRGRWTKEEDNIIVESVASGNTKWSDIAKQLPGRIGDQVKERWVNNLDPEVKRGVWTADEMRILKESQKELGNKWSEIAKRIPGRSENSVKNRWYNQKTSDRRAQLKKEEQVSRERVEEQPMMAQLPMQPEQALYENESSGDGSDEDAHESDPELSNEAYGQEQI